VKSLVLAGAMLALAASAASAQRTLTRFDGIRDCERRGAVQFMQHHPGFRRFVIDRAGIETDRYSDRVGSQFVSTIYRGTATYEVGLIPRKVRFICLHAGLGRGAVFVYTMAE
jgi:hypothetical protein